jgi:Family of unknown function (DUF5995)
MLASTLQPVQRVLGEDYGHGIDVVGTLFGSIDDQVSDWELAHYREQVWWHALAFAAAEETDGHGLVRSALDRTSGDLADGVEKRRTLWRTERAVERLAEVHARLWDTADIEPLPERLSPDDS